MTCCQFATDEEIADDPDAYDCETCEHRLLREALSEDDQQALRLHARLGSRMVHDLRLVPLVFDVARLRLSPREAEELLDRLDLIHEHLAPAPASSDPSSAIGQMDQDDLG